MQRTGWGCTPHHARAALLHPSASSYALAPSLPPCPACVQTKENHGLCPGRVWRTKRHGASFASWRPKPRDAQIDFRTKSTTRSKCTVVAFRKTTAEPECYLIASFSRSSRRSLIIFRIAARSFSSCAVLQKEVFACANGGGFASNYMLSGPVAGVWNATNAVL
jgi:hypothetical protein